MNFGMIVRTVFEVALIAFTLWAVFHEEQIAALEERFFARLRRRRFKVISGRAPHGRQPLRSR